MKTVNGFCMFFRVLLGGVIIRITGGQRLYFFILLF